MGSVGALRVSSVGCAWNVSTGGTGCSSVAISLMTSSTWNMSTGVSTSVCTSCAIGCIMSTITSRGLVWKTVSV